MVIKVLVISSYTGPVNSVRPEAEMFIRLHEAGIQVDVMTESDTFYAEKFREAGMKVIPLVLTRKVEAVAISRIRKELVEGGHQVMHLFTNKAISNGNLAAYGLPVKVVTYRGYTGNIHWWDPTNYLTHLNPRVDKIVCLADSVKNWFDKQLFFDKNKTIVINKGHAPEWFENIKPYNLKEFGIPEGAIVFGCIANIRRMKGLKYLLRATYHIDKNLPVHFILVGDKMDKPKFRKIIDGSPMKSKIHLAGYRKDAMNMMAACDGTVLASIKGEATPKAVIESMYLKIPPILTSIPGNANMVENGKSGIVVEPKNPEAIAKAVEKVAGMSKDQRITMGQHAFQRALQLFDIKDTVRKHVDLYSSLAAE